MLGTAANGILAVAYKLPSIVTVVSNTFTQAWSYSAIKEEDSEDRDAFTSVVFDRLMVVGALLTAFLLAFIEPITRLYVSSEYASAWQFSAWLLVGNYFLTLASFLGASYSVHKDSVGYLLSAIVGAVLNLAIMLPLIPVIGLYGSVVATCVSYISVFVFRLVHTRKYVTVSVDGRKVAVILAALGALLAIPMLLESYQVISATVFVAIAFVFRGDLAALVTPIVKKMKKQRD